MEIVVEKFFHNIKKLEKQQEKFNIVQGKKFSGQEPSTSLPGLSFGMFTHFSIMAGRTPENSRLPHGVKKGLLRTEFC